MDPSLADLSESASATDSANVDTRFSFTAQFLTACAMFVGRCVEIEVNNADTITEPLITEHRGLVVAVIMESVSSIESEIAEILLHGPGHHLGSSGIDFAAKRFINPLADIIDAQPTLEKYNIVLHLLKKNTMHKGEQPWQDMALLVRARNELVHYKSQWGSQMDGRKLFANLKLLNLEKPPFVDPSMNFFPHQFLSAASAKWAVRTAVAFLNAFYQRLGINSPLESYMPILEDNSHH